MKPEILYELKLYFKNGQKITIEKIEEFCFAKKNLFIKTADKACFTFVKDSISEAYQKRETVKNFKKILIPKNK